MVDLGHRRDRSHLERVADDDGRFEDEPCAFRKVVDFSENSGAQAAASPEPVVVPGVFGGEFFEIKGISFAAVVQPCQGTGRGRRDAEYAARTT